MTTDANSITKCLSALDEYQQLRSVAIISETANHGLELVELTSPDKKSQIPQCSISNIGPTGTITASTYNFFQGNPITVRLHQSFSSGMTSCFEPMQFNQSKVDALKGELAAKSMFRKATAMVEEKMYNGKCQNQYLDIDKDQTTNTKYYQHVAVLLSLFNKGTGPRDIFSQIHERNCFSKLLNYIFHGGDKYHFDETYPVQTNTTTPVNVTFHFKSTNETTAERPVLELTANVSQKGQSPEKYTLTTTIEPIYKDGKYVGWTNKSGIKLDLG